MSNTNSDDKAIDYANEILRLINNGNGNNVYPIPKHNEWDRGYPDKYEYHLTSQDDFRYTLNPREDGSWTLTVIDYRNMKKPTNAGYSSFCVEIHLSETAQDNYNAFDLMTNL